ncbi:MAG: DUF559 domain-containing protein [Solirubrobacteraceae bacterium]
MHVCHVFHVAGAREHGLAELAAAQRARVSRAQLLALGFSRGAIDRRVSRCFLHRVLHGVYAVGHPGLAPLAPETAALLYAGDDTVISHASAAAIWGLCPSPARVSTIVRVVVEVDGFATHGTRAAFERDRRRDQILLAAGYTVIRVTWRQLVEQPLAFVARLAQALARAPGRAG